MDAGAGLLGCYGFCGCLKLILGGENGVQWVLTHCQKVISRRSTIHSRASSVRSSWELSNTPLPLKHTNTVTPKQQAWSGIYRQHTAAAGDHGGLYYFPIACFSPQALRRASRNHSISSFCTVSINTRLSRSMIASMGCRDETFIHFSILCCKMFRYFCTDLSLICMNIHAQMNLQGEKKY